MILDRYKKQVAKLSELYAKADKLDEEIPKQLIDKLSLYGQILEILGGLWSAAHADWKKAEAKRKDIIAKTYSTDIEGTNKDREMKAEMAAAETRMQEAEFEGEAMRWKAAYQSVLEQIQIMKKRYEHLQNVANGGV